MRCSSEGSSVGIGLKQPSDLAFDPSASHKDQKHHEPDRIFSKHGPAPGKPLIKVLEVDTSVRVITGNLKGERNVSLLRSLTPLEFLRPPHQLRGSGGTQTNAVGEARCGQHRASFYFLPHSRHSPVTLGDQRRECARLFRAQAKRGICRIDGFGNLPDLILR